MKEELLRTLLQLPGAKKVGSGTEVAIKCPWCGDGNSKHPHCYVGFTETLIFYDCKRCPAGGVLTSEALHKIGVYDIAIHEFVKKNNRVNGSLTKINGSKDRVTQHKIIADYNADADSPKLEYLTRRTGIDFFNDENIRSYKVVTNLKKFLQYNGQVANIPSNLLDEVSDHFVGFMSHNYNVISLRNVNSNMEERYIHYKIDPTKKQPFLYIPPCSIDPLTPTPRIIMAEGAFDIICVKKQFYPTDTVDTIFCATGSIGSYKTALMRMLNLTGFFGADVIVYSDFDKKWKKTGVENLIRHYKEEIFKPYLPLFNFQIIVNQSETEKDFGYLADEWSIKKFSLAS